MKPLRLLSALALAWPVVAAADSDEWFDRLGDSLSWATADTQVRAKLSGTLDLEGYLFEQPAPALVYSEDDSLLVPRLQLFLDAQAGSRVYVFAQFRADRGFDPGDEEWHARFDEYAVRVAAASNGALNLQAGKFATVVGNWVPRHHLWQNPFVNAPLPYENLTGMFDAVPALTTVALLRWANLVPGSVAPHEYLAGLRLPVIWGPSYASGASVSGTLGKFDYALEIKNASLSSRPENWNLDSHGWEYPTFSGRVGWRPNVAWNLGLSGSSGTYLAPLAEAMLPPAYSLNDYQQVTWGADLSYAWHHLQVWAELFAVRFENPRLGPADTFAWYVEARYKFTPQLIGALRLNQQTYGDIPDGAGGSTTWGRDTWRLDVAPSYRFTAHLMLKLQYSLQHRPIDGREYTHVFSGQLLLRF